MSENRPHQGIVMDERWLIEHGADLAKESLEKGKPVPAYLASALQRYAKDFWKRVDRQHVATNLVQRFSKLGYPRAKGSKESAFCKAAEILHVSESTVERWYLDHPPASDEG